MSTRGAGKRLSAVKPEKEETKAVTEEESESKSKARAKLNKALENAENSPEEEEKSSSEEDKPVPAKVIKKEKGDKAATIIKPVPSQQASYIMKLFDRSVNLAKFTEDTSLFPLCRAWMNNNPRALPPKNEAEPARVFAVEEGDVVELPQLSVPSKEIKRKDPTKLDLEKFDKTVASSGWTKEKLLKANKAHWQKIRDKCIEETNAFEAKHFSANFEILMSLQKGNEE